MTRRRLTLVDRIERRFAQRFVNALAHHDLVARAVDEQRSWKQIERAILEGGDPMMLGGGIAGMELTPPIVNETLVTGGATELSIWPTARTPFTAGLQAPKLYRVFATGTSTTAATPGTYTLAARAGNANTSPLFGAVSGALTPVASATAAQWRCFGVIFVRGSDTTGTAVGSFEFNHSGTVGGGGPVSATGNAIYGGISAAVDFSLATNGLWMGVTHATSTTNTWTGQLVAWGSWS
jgi:hypothetical protein